MKFCKDCKHLGGDMVEMCMHPISANIDLVTGDLSPTQTCTEMRKGMCDKNGFYFEPRPKNWFVRLFSKND